MHTRAPRISFTRLEQVHELLELRGLVRGMKSPTGVTEYSVGTMHSEGTWVRRAIEVGARGYVSKNALDCDLSSVILRVAAGELAFASHLPDQHEQNTKRRRGLSARELEVLQLIVNGKSNRQIATQLALSANTVAAHRANIMQALRINKTAELVVYAIRNGLVRLP